MKKETLSNKRRELFNLIDNLEYAKYNNIDSRIDLVEEIEEAILNQDKEFVRKVLERIDKGIKLTIKLYNHKKGEELGAEIYNYLYRKIKQEVGEGLKW